MKTKEDERIKFLHEKVKKLLKQNLDDDEIIDEMNKEGIDASYTSLLIENVKKDNRDRVDFWKLLVMGISFTIAGLYINYVSYSVSERVHSTFFYIFWGIIVAGIVMIIRAIPLYRK